MKIYMKEYLKKRGFDVSEVQESILRTCPLCSVEVNDLGECSVCCGAYRNPQERVNHLLTVFPDLKEKLKEEKKHGKPDIRR